jgi:uncharacterized membrane protein required for colicin V production
LVDLLLLGAIAGLVRGGWTSGFVRRLAGLVFLVVSFLLGAYLREPAGAFISGLFPLIPPQYADMVAYSVVFSALLIAFNLFSRTILSRVAVRGVSRSTDQVLGAVLGGAEAILMISVGIVILHTYTDPTNSLAALTDLGALHDIRTAVDQSTIGQLLSKTTVPIVLTLLGPLLPTDIKSIVPLAVPGGIPGFPIPGLPFPSVPFPSFPTPR